MTYELVSPFALAVDADPGAEVSEVDEEEEDGYDVPNESFEPFDRIQSLFRKPTVGFEFDVHYGFLPALQPAGATLPPEGTAITTHTAATHGFVVKRDVRRLEVNTRPFEVTNAGRTELRETSKRIKVFADDLADRCGKAAPVKVGTLNGFAKPFEHPDIPGVRVAKLPTRKGFTTCSVWASPQATLTIPLAKVATLVERIKASEGKGPGVALTGGASHRMGLRSEALYRALRAVRAARRTAPFSADVEGLLILLASYLWAGELPYRFPPPETDAAPNEDYEGFGKAYLPINVKTPLNQVFGTLLSATDQQVFLNRFAAGPARANLFRLVRPSATTADGSRLFLPPGPVKLGEPGVHMRQKTLLGHVPTWDDLVAYTVSGGPRADKLMVTHSHEIDVSRTRPRVALELRRIGFAAVSLSKWDGYLQRMFALTEELNR